jgi:sorting nexin-25
LAQTCKVRCLHRKVRDLFKIHTEESQILSLINLVREDVWPKGQLNGIRAPRTLEERTKTRHTANQKLSAFMPGVKIHLFCRALLTPFFVDLVASMLGRSNARRGARRIFSVLQNRRLNQHLLYTVLDEVVYHFP